MEIKMTLCEKTITYKCKAENNREKQKECEFYQSDSLDDFCYFSRYHCKCINKKAWNKADKQNAIIMGR